jgi:hypothetical protein
VGPLHEPLKLETRRTAPISRPHLSPKVNVCWQRLVFVQAERAARRRAGLGATLGRAPRDSLRKRRRWRPTGRPADDAQSAGLARERESMSKQRAGLVCTAGPRSARGRRRSMQARRHTRHTQINRAAPVGGPSSANPIDKAAPARRYRDSRARSLSAPRISRLIFWAQARPVAAMGSFAATTSAIRAPFWRRAHASRAKSRHPPWPAARFVIEGRGRAAAARQPETCRVSLRTRRPANGLGARPMPPPATSSLLVGRSFAPTRWPVRTRA